MLNNDEIQIMMGSILISKNEKFSENGQNVGVCTFDNFVITIGENGYIEKVPLTNFLMEYLYTGGEIYVVCNENDEPIFSEELAKKAENLVGEKKEINDFQFVAGCVLEEFENDRNTKNKLLRTIKIKLNNNEKVYLRTLYTYNELKKENRLLLTNKREKEISFINKLILIFKKIFWRIFRMKIIEVRCINEENVTYVEKSHGKFKQIYYPRDCDKITIIFDNNEKEHYQIHELKKYLGKEPPETFLKKHKYWDIVKEILENDSDNIMPISYNIPNDDEKEKKEGECKFAELSDYQDITDKEFNNFDAIQKYALTSSGLWCGNGIKKILLNFDEEFQNFISSNPRFVHDKKSRSHIKELYIIEKDNHDLSNEEIENLTFAIKKDKTDGRFYAFIDTDNFLDFFNNNESEHTFYGKVKMGFKEQFDEENYLEYYFLFPFEIVVKDPANADKVISSEQIGIDFGTSSTCVAYDGGRELLSFNDNPQDIRDYENMTAVIIYSWKKIFEEWKNSNEKIPYFKRSTKKADKVAEDIDKNNLLNNYFDYGDKIKYELANAPDSRTLNAIVSKMKFLPIYLKKYNNKPIVIPFDKGQFKNKIFLTDKLNEENDEILNPIALYAYLIGRSLNRQIRNKLYVNYSLSMPVRFNNNNREYIRSSFEYGLKRALPRGIQEKINVSFDEEEPVALLGAAKRIRKLIIPENKQSALFAVFDFGGGTLDYAFGLYRKASDNPDISIKENELEKYENVVEIFKTDGMEIGGETLIDKLSFQIYKQNKELMLGKNIPICVPETEERIELFPDRLLGTQDCHICLVNLKTLSERFSRKFFIEGKFPSSEGDLELYSINGNEPILISPSKLNIDSISAMAEEFIEEKINDLVDNFRKVLEETFNQNIDRINKFGYDYKNEKVNINDILIFQAGNSCRTKWVKKAFEEYFMDTENIIFLEDEKRKITPKNAVAKGMIMLKNTLVYNHTQIDNNLPIDRYIWKEEDIEELGEDALPVLRIGDNENVGWKFLTMKENNTFVISYSFNRNIEDIDDEELKHITIVIPNDRIVNEDNNSIWIKPYNSSNIECGLANRNGDTIENNNKTFFVNLDNGEVIK